MTTLYKHIIARNGLTARTLRNWNKNGLPYHWVRTLSLQGRLIFHEGAWVLAWDGDEFPIDDKLCSKIKAEQELRASVKLLKDKERKTKTR